MTLAIVTISESVDNTWVWGWVGLGWFFIMLITKVKKKARFGGGEAGLLTIPSSDPSWKLHGSNPYWLYKFTTRFISVPLSHCSTQKSAFMVISLLYQQTCLYIKVFIPCHEHNFNESISSIKLNQAGSSPSCNSFSSKCLSALKCLFKVDSKLTCKPTSNFIPKLIYTRLYREDCCFEICLNQ